ncbi:uncharacterized protein LOC105178913 [Sesamum indicum]|uniref:Uncharacterized protein LOC105178913 n=1 Tax=Sesamum indicum TaxID=4182 RepID=A0A6I9UZY4_SESIN|nr:uncharacterized protein LOC105178913 [Sesamum indicum]
MAFSATAYYWLLVSVLIYIFVSSCKSGLAFEYPHLGAAGVVANEYLPRAENEGETDQYFPQAGIIGTTPLIFSKALECLSDKYIYSSCDEAHRLTQSGELNVPPEFTDQYCNGPCLTETSHVLDCINGILKQFVFINRATVNDVREAIEGGCSYGPKRGNFNVIEHIQADDATNKIVSKPVIYALVLMVIGWRMLF